MKDPIVAQVRAARAKIAEDCGFDLRRIMEHARMTAQRVPGLKLVTKEQLRARRQRTGTSSR